MKNITGLLVTFLMIVCGEGVAKTKRLTPEKILAAYAAECGTHRVAKDASDKLGVTLVAAALKMNPENETALLASALLKRERPVPDIKQKYSEEKFIKLLIKRASGLFETTMPKHEEAGKASRFYYLIAELLRPSDKSIILGLAKLNQKGYDQTLQSFLDNDELITDFLAIPKDVKKTERPPPRGTTTFQKTKKKVNGYGVGERDIFLEKRYGKIRSQRFITKPNEYVLSFYHDSQTVEAYFNFGKCRWVRFPHSYWYSSSTSVLEKKLGVGDDEQYDWVSKGNQKYESKDGKYVAFVDESYKLNIWETKWYIKNK